LYANNYIFNYANKFVSEHDTIADPESFEITDAVFADFKEFVTEQDFDYSTETESLIEGLKKSAERESYLTALNAQIEVLDSLVKEEKKHDIEKFKSDIKELLLLEIVSRYYYQRGRIIATIKSNAEVKKAIGVLSDNELYSSILNGSYQKADCEK
ncbi:MAG: peptidase S41, partial [Bacteroidetes bacterium]